MKLTFVLVAIVAFSAVNSKSDEKVVAPSVLEVTTFSLKTVANSQTFNDLDTKVQENFTSKQPGFIRRESGVNENGEYTVIVYWKTLADAEASMNKFMSDGSVADYAGMIEGSTMKMNRFTINADFTAENSEFVEMMDFNLGESVAIEAFDTANENVAKETATRKGFMQRITGVDENGKQVVVIYWDTKENSDAALQPFMSSPTSKKFMGMMDSSTMMMTRSQILTSLEQTEITN